jgi:hypothetical protein
MKHVKLYIFLYFTSGFLLDSVYRSLDRVARGYSPPWLQILVEQGSGYYLAMALLPGVFYVARKFPPAWSFQFVFAHLGAVICYSAVHTSLMWGTRLILFPLFGLGHYDYGAMPARYFMELPAQLIHYATLLIAYAVYQSWLRSKQLESQLTAARLELLSHQLQPHFLFNALNAVSAAIYEDRDRADRMLERIADFLRATLKLPDSPLVPVSTEISLARQYLEIMKARMEDRLAFEIVCDKQAESAQAPSLLLQPLIENAVEHGQDPATGKLDIGIGVTRRNGILSISIRDRGRGFPPHGAVSPSGNGSGHGLANVRKRLAAAYGDRASLRLSTHAEGGAMVEIAIPQ